eukprot:Seg552.1 transcript_id=Seg552.1/GoldUCD/mRNA.D3Y31 product="hypothetical protein" protein_id=Seg552.1/GoldUCD/D3Y31
MNPITLIVSICLVITISIHAAMSRPTNKPREPRETHNSSMKIPSDLDAMSTEEFTSNKPRELRETETSSMKIPNDLGAMSTEEFTLMLKRALKDADKNVERSQRSKRGGNRRRRKCIKWRGRRCLRWAMLGLWFG